MADDIKIFSADSHVSEPGDLWVERLDKEFRWRAPKLERRERNGKIEDLWVYEGWPPHPVGVGLGAAGVGEVVAPVDGRGESATSGGNARLEVACAGCGGAVLQRQSQHAIGLPAYCTDVCRRKMKTQRERARIAARRLGGA